MAPIAGTVLNLSAREGGVITGASSVSEGTVLMELADLQRLEVQSSVNEIDVGLLKPDMPVEVTFDSAPDKKVEGRLSFIAPSAGEAGEKTERSAAKLRGVEDADLSHDCVDGADRHHGPSGA